MSDELKQMVSVELIANKGARLAEILKWLEIPRSSWYYKPKDTASKKRRQPLPIPSYKVEAIKKMAERNPWYGYKRIAVMCRRSGVGVSNRQVYRVMKANGLLQKRKRGCKAGLYQASKLYELLPTKPNELWQMDVTYVHIPTYGWRYVVTVIDYYSRYLLAARLTWSYCAAEVILALEEARHEAERICGPLEKEPFLVTDNGSSFLAKRFVRYVRDEYVHVRIQYRTPTQLGLLERFHQTLKDEEVYWRMYDDPEHARKCIAEFRERYNNKRPHWALIPEEGGDPVVPQEVYTGICRTRLPRWQAWARDIKAKLDKELQLAA